jgi:uncharacterized GH25 family protein
MRIASRHPIHARSLAILAPLILAGFALVAEAHDTWLLPASATSSRGRQITLDLTSGMSFPALDHAIASDRLARAAARLGGTVTEIAERRPAKGCLRLSHRFLTDGIATLWVETKPNPIELTTAQVEEYLAEIGAADTVGREWKALGSPKWREVYTKHAKTFVRVGRPSKGDRSWVESTGMALELVPEDDPMALALGKDLRLRVVRNGQPLAGFPVGFVASGEQKDVLKKTDREGRVAFPLLRKGWILVRATHVQRTPGSDGEWESHFTTLTVKVR